MKAVKYILLSYFQQNFFGTLGMVIALVFFIFGNIAVFKYGRMELSGELISWKSFYLGLILLLAILSIHLKRMVKSNASALLPDYKKRQSMAACFWLLLFAVWPVIITSYFGFPLLLNTAVFLFTTAVCLNIFFKYGDHIIPLLFIIWILRLVYELAGITVEAPLFSALRNYWPAENQVHFSVILLLISFLLLYFFVRSYFKLSILDFENENGDNTDPWARDFDKTGPILARLLDKKLQKTTALRKGSYLSKLIKLFQFSLFSPGIHVSLNSIHFGFMLLYMASVYFLLSGWMFLASRVIIVVLTLIYQISAAFIAADFLHHRSHLSMLWVWAGLDSRKKFSRVSALAYYFTAAKQYIIVTLSFIVITASLNLLSPYEMLILMVYGLSIYAILPSLSLIFSSSIQSPSAKGWTFTNIIAAIIMMPIFDQLIGVFSWPVFLTLMIIGIISIWRAMNIWKHSEYDFSGPEVYL